MSEKILKLNLGAGTYPIEGYENLDRKTGQEIYPLEDYEDDSVDEIRVSHVLEHFSYRDTFDVLTNWVSKLKPGGRLCIAVPDTLKVTEAYLSGVNVNIQGILMGGQNYEDNFHKALFDREGLVEVMAAVGLIKIRDWEPVSYDSSDIPWSLNVMGYKPIAPEQDISKDVRAVLGAARFGPTLHFSCITAALNPLRIPTKIVQGCFWHQNVTRAMKDALDDKCKYVLTLDYDTIFSPADVMEMYLLMEAHEHIDAICAVQSKRSSDACLFGKFKREDGSEVVMQRQDFDPLVTQVDSGHFGLTMIRASSLEQLKKPWMRDEPDSNGDWIEDEKVDADISFWRKWKEQNFTLYLANHIAVGHVQEVVTWPHEQDFRPIHQSVSEYKETGKPPEAVK
jgi:predicted SAM-dependent methyltransferase